MQQGIDQCAFRMTRARMDHQSNRFVDDQQMTVLIHQIQRNGFRAIVGSGRERGGQQHFLPTLDPILATKDLSIDAHGAILDPGLKATSGEIREQNGQYLIQALARRIHRDLASKQTGGHRDLVWKWTGLLLCSPSSLSQIKTGSIMHRELARAILPILVGAVLTGCSVFKSKDSDEYAGWSAEKFYTEAKQALTGGAYQRAVTLYEKLEARYPFGTHATQAQLDIAYAYYKNDEPESAIAAVDRFISANPRSEAVDYAYYLRALVNYNRGISFIDRFMPTDSSQRDPNPAREAYKQFDELVTRFPDGKYAEDARKRMVALRNNLAVYETHVADYYLRRGAYLAAARRSSDVIRDFQRTPAVPGALRILETAYRQLDVPDLAEAAQRVYTHNYAQGVPGGIDGGRQRTLIERLWDFTGLEKDD